MAFKIFFMIGFWVAKGITSFFRLLKDGIIRGSSDNKPLLMTYIGLMVAMIISYFAFGSFAFILFIFVIVALFSGFVEQGKEFPSKQRKEYFDLVFHKIGLLADDESAPIYLYENKISEYAILFAFTTFIPLNEWEKRKELLEMNLSAKILDIKQDDEDYRKVLLVVRSKPLPKRIDWNDCYIDREKNILNVGFSYYGIVGIDLDKSPHVFVAGETGGGKSNVLKCLIYQALKKEYDVVLIDFKRGVSFSAFSNAIEMYYEHIDTMKLLQNMVIETKGRLDLFRYNRVENIKEYNRITNNTLKRKIIFIDELAELLQIRDKEISNTLYDALETLARLSRSAGIHLIMATQRPDSTIITGQIKSNVSFRLCGRFPDPEASRIVLGSKIANELPTIRGRFIAKLDRFEETQCFYYDNIYIAPKRQNTKHESHKEAQYKGKQENKKDTKKTEQTSGFNFDFQDMKKDKNKKS